MNNKCPKCGGQLLLEQELEGDVIKCFQCSRTPPKEDLLPLIQERNEHPNRGITWHGNKIPSYKDKQAERKAITQARNAEIKGLWEAGTSPSELGKAYKLRSESIKTICYRTNIPERIS